MILEGLNNYYKCKQCAKQYTCNKEKCKPVLWHDTKRLWNTRKERKMIEVGEYVRTKKGYIAKITEVDNYIWFNEKINKESGIAVYELSKVEFTNLVVKHSKNIIDLIEVGDYVNGEKVERINDYGDFKRVDFNLDYDDGDAVYEEDIKSIVTKEQFARMKYKIKE